MVNTKQDLFGTLSNNKNKLQKLGVSRIGVFGSFVSDEQTKSSDVDLLVEFIKGKKNFHNFMNTADYAESILGRKVDLVTPEALSPYIGPHIMKNIQYVQIA
ncbi:MAG: polymerase, beta domain protein region protein [Microgenomates group bacterium GW2011_GWC1_39_7b]|uniref:Polymerase, beta domain protein region protein n=3 Tax=Candidatus Woeseibacteriota TaxID=1752722 RepID=A0A0G0PS42_9BACT|nr:MAG: polymerase, beta domain protein region protein [Candidatus Woesebacteria bacterium GW2011_GWB1_39_10]KKR26768.1 MAG: polymerase, beta domain protein region protein [Microgenomates group bacterium GW2011_GWC1_39_7b]KKR73592.1 MAG: polymerase, beta domain protein region protein [Candidatus Woesebacteria bacterium GW2011_GWA2_40_7]KKS91116.1 MAG: polymerase, beta domain protein region protein [Candidatus Woesebacteria bacterium GW2011_GWA1_43_12]